MAGCACRGVPEERMNGFKCIFEMELPELIFRGLTVILQQYSFDAEILQEAKY